MISFKMFPVEGSIPLKKNNEHGKDYAMGDVNFLFFIYVLKFLMLLCIHSSEDSHGRRPPKNDFDGNYFGK